MKIIDDLLGSVAHADHLVTGACVGLHWTVIESLFAGASHTYKTNRKVELADSGDLIGRSALELAGRLRSWEPLEAGLGLAALNSLIPIPEDVDTGNVFDHVVAEAEGKTITVIGRFPFNDRLAETARRVYFLEMDPHKDELPSFAAEEVIPQSDIAVITATTLINKSLPRLLELSERAEAIVLGPSTPMNDVLFDHGADVLAGVRVDDADALLRSIMQGVKRFKRLAGITPVVRRKG